MSSIIILIVIVLNIPFFVFGILLVVSGLYAVRTQSEYIIRVAAAFGSYLVISAISFLWLLSSKDKLAHAYNAAEGGITEIPMVAMFSLGVPFWTVLGIATALLVSTRNIQRYRSSSGAAFLAIASFNYFIIIYGQKILVTMGVPSGSMRDWCC